MENTINFRIKFESNGKEVFKNLKINAEDFNNLVKLTTEKVKSLDSAMDGFAKRGFVLSALKDITDSLNQAIGSLADSYNDFDEGMRAVNTMAGLNSSGLKELKTQVEKLSESIPLAKKNLSEGLYQVISNGVPKDNWIGFLDKSAKASVGGIADLGKVVTVTSTLIKNYGLEWQSAGDIQDKIQNTAKNGVTSFEQLAEALPRVAGQASVLDVTVNELLASFATLTGVSGNTAEVATQLSAVFTAIVKPSSEAIELAEKMGIKFDAAAIKAAGGFESFLQNLKFSITEYSKATGVLEQEVYGKLFGSAQALRALIPLSGELATKFSENVSSMEDSTGAIDNAFKDMSESGRASIQKFKNSLTNFTDSVGKFASYLQPLLLFGATTTQTALGLDILKKNLVELGVKTKILSIHQKVQAIAQRLVASSAREAALGTTAMTVATTALYAALTLGISLLIMGLVAAFSALKDKTEDTKEKVDELKDVTDAYKTSASTISAELKTEITELRNLISANKDATSVVDALNRKYGEAFGLHSTAQEWYNILIQCSKDYCKQIGYEAQAKVLASKMAENELEKEAQQKKIELAEQKYKNAKANVRIEKSINLSATGSVPFVLGKKEAEEAKEDLDKQKAILTDLNKKSNEYQSTWEQIQNAILEAHNNINNTLRDINKTAVDIPVADMTMDNITAELKAIEDKITKSGNLAKRELLSLQNRYKALNTEKERRTKLIPTKAGVSQGIEADFKPLTLDKVTTLEDLDKNLSYYNNALKKAVGSTRSNIQKIIKAHNELKTAWTEEAEEEPISVAQIKTYKELEQAEAYYNKRLKSANAEERVVIKQNLKALKELKESWENVLNTPAAIGNLNTIRELNEAISYYQNSLSTAGAEEVEIIQKTITALTKKKEAILDITKIPALSTEVAELQKLNKRQLKIKLELLGLEGVKEKILTLQKLLQNTNLNPKQKKEVQSLISVWGGYEQQLKRSSVNVKHVYSSVKMLGGGIEAIKGAIESNNSAWQKLTGIIDGAISVYDGLKSVIDVIKMITTATTAQTAAEGVKTAVTATSTATKIAGDSVETASSVAKTGVIASETAAFLGLATAKTFSAHASIPFVGIGLALGAAAIIAATVASNAKKVPKFANGGIAYGPTLGIFGEYAGAKNNPEVVAPLDRLKSLIEQPTAGAYNGTVSFKVKGRDLVGVLANETRILSKGGRKTNIKL